MTEGAKVVNLFREIKRRRGPRYRVGRDDYSVDGFVRLTMSPEGVSVWIEEGWVYDEATNKWVLAPENTTD